MLIMKSRKRETTERKVLPNQENIRTLGEKENYKYLGILAADTSGPNNDNNKAIRTNYIKQK